MIGLPGHICSQHFAGGKALFGDLLNLMDWGIKERNRVVWKGGFVCIMEKQLPHSWPVVNFPLAVLSVRILCPFAGLREYSKLTDAPL